MLPLILQRASAQAFLKCRDTGERMDLLSGFQGGWGQGVGKGLDQDAWIFPLHTAFSNVDLRTIELKGTWEIISSPSSFVHRRKNREMK